MGYTATYDFKIETTGMTPSGGHRERIRVADQSLEMLLDSLQKVGVDVQKESSQKDITYPFQNQHAQLTVPLEMVHPKEVICGYELQAKELKIRAKNYDSSRSLGGRGVIGAPVEYRNGIEVRIDYKGTTLAGFEEKCKKVEDVFKGLYDSFTRAWNEKLAAMTPEERAAFEQKSRKLGRELMKENQGKK